MDYTATLKKLGFSEKEIKVYLTSLKLGPAPVRLIAQVSEVNRGTTYDILRSLIDQGLVSYYHKDKKQYFVAEDPDKLKAYLDNQISGLKSMATDVEKLIPQLKSVFDLSGSKPVVKYYEGSKGVKNILEDVLDEVEKNQDKEYFVYSSKFRENLYKGFPNFTKERIKRNIHVKVISLGKSTEKVAEMAERKNLNKESAQTYIIIYGRKSAFITTDKAGNLIGVVIEAEGINQTMKVFFNFMWEVL